MFLLEIKTEDLGGGVRACVSESHFFGADSILLAAFAPPRPNEAACDLCSGCGIIPLLWFRGEGPKTAAAVDILPGAVDLIKHSAALNGLEGRLLPMLADLRELKSSPGFGGFDLITCNPPYRAAGSGALSQSDSARAARHETMCTLEDCCTAASRLLRFGGRFCLCHLPERLADVFGAMRRNNIEPKRLRLAQKDKASAPWLALVEGRLGGKPSLKAEPALLMFEDGEASEEMRKIYEGRCLSPAV